MQSIFNWWDEEKVQLALLAEVNLFWPRVPPGHQWRDRARNVKGSKSYYAIAAHNTKERREWSTSTSQYGGCATAAFGPTAHRAKSSGVDQTGLGRWAWIRLRGRARTAPASGDMSEEMEQQTKARDLVVVAAYRPHKLGPGQSTVAIQQRTYLLSQGRDEEPRDAFTADLGIEIEQWREEGCEIIIGIDANEDLTKLKNGSFREKMNCLGLHEAIIARHPQSPPATQQRNKKSSPIDGFFVTPGVVVCAGGYYAFDQFCSSDHRAIWIDINLKQSTGGYEPTKNLYKPRRLVLQDSRVVATYLRIAEEGYHRWNIPQTLQRLHAKMMASGGILSDQDQRTYSWAHQKAYECRTHAERKCRKLRMGGVPWSPPMQEIWNRIKLWEILIKAKQNMRVSSTRLRRLLKKTALPQAWQMSLEDIRRELAVDVQTRNDAKRANYKKARVWRSQHLQRLQDMKTKKEAKPYGLSRRQRILRLKQTEETRRRKAARNKGTTGGLRMVQVEGVGPTGVPITVIESSKEQVESRCAQENALRYDQTRYPFPTPPMCEPLFTLFTGPHAKANSFALLQGTLDLPGDIDDPTARFLNQCRSGHKPSSPVSISHEEHTWFWRKMKENRGSEPHGLHNGHLKAGATSFTLGLCDSLFRSIPYFSGLIPTQWQHLMNFAIEKTPGDFRPQKMRTIQLMNSEFQSNNKYMGRQAMHFAELNNLIPPGQCGSRKRHRAIDTAVSKRLTWDLLLARRQTAGWVCNDAKSCFDRVVHWVAMIALLRFGVPWPALVCAFGVLASATHRVRTAFGDSTLTFSPPTEVPFQGCGQGNGAGPTIWVAISAILIDTMITAGHGFECLTAIGRRLVLAQCFSFVDDTDVVEAAQTVDTGGELILQQVQAALNLWSGGIRATGGALNPDKSFWWFLDWRWDPSSLTYKFRTIREMEGELKLQGLDGRLATLRRLEPGDAERTLGVYMAPLEDGEAQLKVLRQKARDWANNLRPHLLLPYDVFPLIRSTILKTLEYPMPLTTYDQATWEKIFSPVLMICLPKAGICRTFPRAVVYGPVRFQGLGLPHPFASQVASHLEMLMRHLSSSTQTGVFMAAVLESHQLETGTSFSMFQQVFENTGILTSDTWIKRVWRELDSMDLHLETPIPQLELQRVNDVFIMEAFMDQEVDQDTLKRLNWCRLYLRVTTLSDVTTADGIALSPTAWSGIRDRDRLSRYDWPRTESPTLSMWKLWRHWLARTFLVSDSNRLLRQPLGDWIAEPTDWNWLFSPNQMALYHRAAPGVWTEAHQVPSRGRNLLYSLPDQPPSLSPLLRHRPVILPDDVRPASVVRDLRPSQNTFHLHSYGRRWTPVQRTPSQSFLTEWRYWRTKVRGTDGWVPESVQVHGDEKALAKALRDGKLYVISDGSFKDGDGTSATQLTTRDCKHKIWLICRTPGLTSDQSAYRSELMGILAGLMGIQWLAFQWGTTEDKSAGSTMLACDGLQAIRQTFGTHLLAPTQPQFDVLITLRATLEKTSLSVNPRHVKGHGDKHLPWSKLSWWERRNIECDNKAGAYRETLSSQGVRPPPPRFFLEPISLFHSGVKMSSLDRDYINELVTLPALRRYWHRRRNLHQSIFETVDWDVVEKAMLRLQPGERRWVSKHLTGMCGVGKFLKLWGQSDSDGCPRCGLPEDHRHVYSCQAPSAQLIWDSCLREFATFLSNQQTAPAISTALIYLLRQNYTTPVLPFKWDRQSTMNGFLLEQTFRRQESLGPQGLLDGLLTKDWPLLQDQHFRSIGSPRQGTSWAISLSHHLLLIGHRIWLDRNSIQHSTESFRARTRTAEIDERLRAQWSLGVIDLPPFLHPTVKRPLHRLLRLPLVDKEAWVSQLESERLHFRRSHARQRQILRDAFVIKR